jgi:hypothetical protein
VFVSSGVDSADALRNGMMIALLSLLIGAIFLFSAGRHVGHEEATRMERARAAGEPGL